MQTDMTGFREVETKDKDGQIAWQRLLLFPKKIKQKTITIQQCIMKSLVVLIGCDTKGALKRPRSHYAGPPIYQ